MTPTTVFPSTRLQEIKAELQEVVTSGQASHILAAYGDIFGPRAISLDLAIEQIAYYTVGQDFTFSTDESGEETFTLNEMLKANPEEFEELLQILPMMEVGHSTHIDLTEVKRVS